MTLCFNKKRISTFLFCITFCFVITFNFAVPRKTYAFVLVDDIAVATVATALIGGALIAGGLFALYDTFTLDTYEKEIVADADFDLEGVKKGIKNGLTTAKTAAGDAWVCTKELATDVFGTTKKYITKVGDFLNVDKADVNVNSFDLSCITLNTPWNGIFDNPTFYPKQYDYWYLVAHSYSNGFTLDFVQTDLPMDYYSSAVIYQPYPSGCGLGVRTHSGAEYRGDMLVQEYCSNKWNQKYKVVAGETAGKVKDGYYYNADKSFIIASNCLDAMIVTEEVAEATGNSVKDVVIDKQYDPSVVVDGVTYPISGNNLSNMTIEDYLKDHTFEYDGQECIAIPIPADISDVAVVDPDSYFYDEDDLISIDSWDVPIDVGNIGTNVPDTDVNTGVGDVVTDIPDTDVNTGVGDVVTDAPSTGFDLSGILDFLKKILDAILSIPSAISSAISSGISNILDFLKKILDAILSIPSVILSGIESIFIPREGFLEDIIDDIKIALDKAFGIGTFDINLIPINEKKFDDMYATINIGSYEFTFKTLDASFLLLALDKFRKYIRAFLYFALFLYNINQFMGLIGQPNLTIGALKGSNETIKGVDDE